MAAVERGMGSHDTGTFLVRHSYSVLLSVWVLVLDSLLRAAVA